MDTIIGFDFYTSHTRVSDNYVFQLLLMELVMALIGFVIRIGCIVLWG